MADDTITLRIYRAPNGQWSRELFAGDRLKMRTRA